MIQTFVPEHSSAALRRHRPSLQGVAFRTNPKAQVTGCRWGATQQGLPLHPPVAGHSGHSPQHGPSGQSGACTPTSQPPVLASFPRTMQTIAGQSCGAQLLLKAQDPRSSPEPGAGPAEIALTAGTAEEQPAPRAQDSSVPCLEREQRAETAAGAGGRPCGLERHALGGSGRPVPSTGVSPPRPVPNARSRCTHFRGKFLGCFLCSLFSAWLLPSSCSFTGRNRWRLVGGGCVQGKAPRWWLTVQSSALKSGLFASGSPLSAFISPGSQLSTCSCPGLAAAVALNLPCHVLIPWLRRAASPV